MKRLEIGKNYHNLSFLDNFYSSLKKKMPSYLISIQLPSSSAAELNENKIGRLRTPAGPKVESKAESKAPKIV